MRLIALIVAALIFYKPLNGQIISTFAGNGTSGHTGDNGLANIAKINNPVGCSFDKNGNFYFAEFQSHCIRKVDANGIITTVAGTTMFGYNGDGIPATSAKLYFPNAVVTDTVGNLYISDGNNCRIRKVDINTGLISTFVGNGICGFSGDGGAATSAQLRNPGGIYFDSYGNLFISDPNNRRLRVVSSSTGVINTYAGNGSLGSTGNGGPATNAAITPGAICVDDNDNVYIADYSTGQNRIAKVNHATGIISTIAGTDTGFIHNGEGIPATSANIAPSGIIFDDNGNLFVADGYNDRIRKITTAGYIYTVAGTGFGGYGGDGGNATSAQLDQPYGLAFDSCGNLCVSDVNNSRIRKIAFNPTCAPTSIVDAGKDENSISISPNPATTALTISSGTGISNIAITNMLGQSVCRHMITKGEKKTEVSISHLPLGMYLVRVNDKWVQRFMKE
jgi:sugar lactone lactonase YvrE